MTQKQASVWFITGCSTGFGRELARAVVARGFGAAVTAREAKDVTDIVAGHEDHTLALRLDVTDPAQVADSVRAAEEHFGGIDVLVNNAGIGYFAAVEESEEKDVRRMFEIDFFGLARMIHAVLPGMRKRRRGHIVNIASICGLAPFASLGYYCGAKFAVEGLSECLAMEVGPLGIKVTLVEPSGFRTNWAGRSANDASIEIADYAPTAGAVGRQLREQSGKQPGDPARAANAIIQVVEAPNPPLHLLLGKDALRLAHEKLDHLRRDFDAWQSVTVAADFPTGEPAKVA
ncbi:MAG: short-chain dehydrogenase/reductase [Proteobacteria bacterium]|nr:MAG: short-chain dehydrogenase/reductase [Pseudomonadota bacterium]